MNRFSNKTEKYLYSRDVFRKKHQTDFLKLKGDINLLITSTNELVASLTLFFSGKDLRAIENGFYYGDLVVSYCRSHFIISDLLLGGELVEATTLLRKQMELISRLNELSKGVDIENLIRKTPNLKNLKTGLRKLYALYSEITHSASPEIMQILGMEEYEGKMYTVLYPQFQENSYIGLQHQTVCALEFYTWCVNFLVDNFQDYKDYYDAMLFKTSIEKYQEIYK